MYDRQNQHFLHALLSWEDAADPKPVHAGTFCKYSHACYTGEGAHFVSARQLILLALP